MSTLLSIHDGHNASAALLVDGKILSCVSEERLNRKKFYWGFPTQAIEYVFSSRKINPKTVDVICDVYGKIVSVNAAALKLLGQDDESKLIGTPISTVIDIQKDPSGSSGRPAPSGRRLLRPE
jgi:predicted NodU family carbamoyl transferase